MFCKIISRVKDPTSVLDIQLLSFSSIGKGSLDLADFSNQQKSRKVFEIRNAANRRIGELHMFVQFQFSLRQMYIDELEDTKRKIKVNDERTKAYQSDIDKLYLIFPCDDKPDLNLRSHLRKSHMMSEANLLVKKPWVLVLFVCCLLLVTLNLIYSMTEPNMFELACVAILIVEICIESTFWYYSWVVVVSLLLIAKDLLYMFVFNVTDYTYLIISMEGGESLYNVIKTSHILGIILKSVIAVVLVILNRQNKEVR